MAQPAKTQCPACNGRTLVSNKNGQSQVCPLCDGTGAVTPQPIRVPYWFTFTKTALTGNQQNIQVPGKFDTDAPFEWVWLMADHTGTFDSRFEDTTGRKMDNDFIPDTCRYGTAQLPFPIVEPYIFAPGTSFLITLTDTSGVANTIRIVFQGFKLYSAD